MKEFGGLAEVAPRRSPDRVQRAEAILNAQAGETVSLGAVAAGVGLGLRSLQIVFRATLGVSPRRRLAQIRLDQARARLLDPAPGETVTSIALDCGFTHLGRFPGAYLRAFGELPSQTLKRARGCAAPE
ncbi:helix-turn-helix transcriptional regulator [Rhodobacter capsulatus]|uniref:Helix-turn-helix transcriptional regulator n=1 Tax=Rhodobacter capsulatus TaxID=1061 RepID=A0A4U1JIN0_RHOCA|nr:AraC family transcriptional regulator [Rhodobacter capsulatus]TKD12539.1 helix-turn-helix transcriptional regulator [Rhodobacter capsulatus]